MKKEKVYIVINHKHVLKPGKGKEREWQVQETIEFVNQLRTRHHTMSAAIGDFINRKMISGERNGMTSYEQFETYIANKYEKELAQLDKAYGEHRIKVESVPEPESIEITDQFGNVREPTVFDKVE